MKSRATGEARRTDPTHTLEGAWAELNQLLLEETELEGFLRGFADLVAALVPGTHCVASVRGEDGQPHVAASTATATRGGAVPGQRMPVPPGAGDHDSSGGSLGGVAIPLMAGGVDLGILRVLATSSRAFRPAEIERVQRVAELAGPAVMLVLRQSAHLQLDEQLQEAVVTRAVIDQALGVLMHARKVSSRQAFEELRQASQATNRKVSDIAADVIETLTGHPPEPPRPLSPRAVARRDVTAG